MTQLTSRLWVPSSVCAGDAVAVWAENDEVAPRRVAGISVDVVNVERGCSVGGVSLAPPTLCASVARFFEEVFANRLLHLQGSPLDGGASRQPVFDSASLSLFALTAIGAVFVIMTADGDTTPITIPHTFL